MTPVPGVAGFNNTPPAPKWPTTWCGIDPDRVTGTWNMLFLATSPALRIASATSLALPRPTPTRPFWSPIATIALNENRRPPFTTLAHRFTLITRSMNSDLGASDPRTSDLLEIQTAGASAVGERLDAPVVQVAAAVEAHLLDALLARPLGEQLADRRADRGLALALDAGREILAARRGREG